MTMGCNEHFLVSTVYLLSLLSGNYFDVLSTTRLFLSTVTVGHVFVCAFLQQLEFRSLNVVNKPGSVTGDICACVMQTRAYSR